MSLAMLHGDERRLERMPRENFDSRDSERAFAGSVQADRIGHLRIQESAIFVDEVNKR
jgi:hypothetical protein